MFERLNRSKFHSILEPLLSELSCCYFCFHDPKPSFEQLVKWSIVHYDYRSFWPWHRLSCNSPLSEKHLHNPQLYLSQFKSVLLSPQDIVFEHLKSFNLRILLPNIYRSFLRLWLQMICAKFVKTRSFHVNVFLLVLVVDRTFNRASHRSLTF